LERQPTTVETRATTSGGLVKITIQVTQEQLARLDDLTPPHGSRADLIRRYVAQGLDRDQRLARIADALEPEAAAV